MSTKITIIDKEDYEKWEVIFEKGELTIIRDGFENGVGVYRGDFECDKTRLLYEAMKKYYGDVNTP